MNQAPVRITAPAETPLTVEEVKDYLRVSHEDEDEQIVAILDAAISRLDGWSGILGRCLVTQTWQQDFDAFPDGSALRLPFPNVQSVVITYRDTAEAEQTFDAANWRLVSDATGSLVYLADGAVWPDTATRPDAVRVTMLVGYGAATAVPPAIKMALKMDCGAMYEVRDGSAVNTMAYDSLIRPFRRMAI